MRAQTKTFEMMVDGQPLEVKATPFVINEETRFRVSYNGSPVHIFVYDPSLSRLRAVDDNNEIPDNIDEAIGIQLRHRMAA